MATDPRVDRYIADKPAFAQPIMTHLRALMHRASPRMEETVKWGRPFFTLDGRMLGMMAAFKAHCTFGFWRSEAGGPDRGESAGGDYGRITSLADLPADEVLIAQMQAAIANLAEPAKRVRATPRPPIEPPRDLIEALADNPAAQAGFDGFPPSARYDYVEWIAEAKRPETRAKRIGKAIAQLEEGKRLHHKYQS